MGADSREKSELCQSWFTIGLPNLDEKGVEECREAKGVVSISTFVLSSANPLISSRQY